MSKLFEEQDSDDDIGIKTDNDFAKNYDVWRKKEELHKLQMKYGDDVIRSSDDSSSSSDSEGLGELDEEDDKKFFKTLSCLIAKKDPGHLYDNEASTKMDRHRRKSKKRDDSMYIKDYERKLILEKGGKFSDSEDEETSSKARSTTYVEEQRQLKDSLKGALQSVSDSDNEEPFKPREERVTDSTEEGDYAKWLAGQNPHLDDKQLETELEPLRAYWSDPNLDDGEKFLRDYILNKRYLEKDDENYCPRYDEIIHDSDQGLSDDEEELEKAEQFEYKYNFRFEEPDPEFIKTYPRTMQNSVRRPDDRRKIKRAETKDRKQKEKQQKMDELKTLQKLKKEEIEEKIAKLKEITGSTDVGFSNEDIDGDFNPDEHDRRMQTLFDDEFYQGPEGEQKPEFPDLDEELEIENWNKWDGNVHEHNNEEGLTEPHCEDDNFNMDCDYDPQAVKKEMIESDQGRKKRRRKSKFAEVVSKPKPHFDPNDKSYEEYLDEYYKLDCEDIIGDIPCRFKYRKVVPNSFGLTMEEILMANDRELNRWCSLKKAVQHRPDHVEKYDQIAYAKKAQNVSLKKKILPSLFSNENGFDECETSTDTSPNSKKSGDCKNKSKCDDNHHNELSQTIQQPEIDSESKDKSNTSTQVNQLEQKKKKKAKKRNSTSVANVIDDLDDENVNRSKLNKKDSGHNSEKTSQLSKKTSVATLENSLEKKKSKKKKKKDRIPVDASNANRNSHLNKTKGTEKTRKRKIADTSKQDQINLKKKKAKKSKGKDVSSEISDARLVSFGYNPKKYKNKLKYKQK